MANIEDLRHGARVVHRNGREGTYLAPGRAHDRTLRVWYLAKHSDGWIDWWREDDIVSFQNIERYELMQEVSDGTDRD